MRFLFVDRHKEFFSTKRLCTIAGVSRSGYYAWKKRKPSKRSMANRKLIPKIQEIFTMSRKTYGSRRVQKDLESQGYPCSKSRVLRLMKSMDLTSTHTKRYRVCTTDSKHANPIADNVIARDFTSAKVNQKWGTDITYIHTQEGFLYVAVVMDFYSRKIVCLAMSNSLETKLCLEALQSALVLRQAPKDLVHHSDRGVQYTSHAYQKLLQDHKCIVSMSRKGNCWDNAMVESFFHTLKVECVYQTKYKTRKEAKIDITDYIYNFYNQRRIHSSLDYLSPAQYENIAA